MAIVKMELVSLTAESSMLEAVLEKCCESGCFQMENAITALPVSGKRSLQLLNDKNPYEVPLKGLASIATELDITLRETNTQACKLETDEDFNRFNDSLENSLRAAAVRKQEALRIISERKGAVKQIEHLQGLNEQFDRIFSCKHVHVRVGKLPLESRAKLEYYDKNFFFVPFDTDRSYCWGMYFCPKESKDIVDDIFTSLFFEVIRIPDFVTGNTAEAFERLEAEIKEQEKVARDAETELRCFADVHDGDIQRAYSKLVHKRDIFNLRKKVGVLRDKVFIKGFIPLKEKDRFAKLFEDLPGAELTFMPPDADSSCKPPTVLKNSWFTRPYSMLVEMYGLPDYTGYNPTAFVAITYTLLFGVMFGDLGQGFIIFLLGLLIGTKVHKQFGGMMTRCGVSSMIFGTIYGSVFGMEELLDPVFEGIGIDFLPLHPFKNTTFILLTAVAMGAALIIISMILNIIIGFKEHDIERAVFSNNGIAGLIFYSSIGGGLVATIMFDVKVMSAPFVLFLIVIPAICIFCRVPFAAAVKYKELRLSEDGEKMTVGNFIVENFFEMFEYALSYVSNTMSFLRVGGFVLSHAGMMLVVTSLMGMVGSGAKLPVMIIGNAFVMIMEGMIVAIQIIRLEFYEIFSRFYSGDGKPFEPVKAEFTTELD
ncbi:MAG: ATPase [Ruminococcus sp.]|nr:ATPase [Ruminococcus sp.]